MLRRLLLAACLLLPAAAGATGVPDPACLRLELLAEATVPGTVYRLGDVARSAGQGCAASEALELGRTPRPGYWAHVTRQQIAARLEREWPGARRALHWRGADTVRVAPLGEAVAGARVARVAEAALRSELVARYARVEIAPVDAPDELLVPAGRVVLRAADLAGVTPSRRLAVWVDVEVDGRHYRSVPVWFGVSAWSRALAVVRDLESHHVLEPGDLGETVVDVAVLGHPPVVDPALATGQRLRRPLAEGDVLLAAHVEPAPMVQRGTLVDVFARSGHVVLRAKGQAQSDGDLDQRILVTNPKNGERYAAIVVGQGQVEAQ